MIPSAESDDVATSWPTSCPFCDIIAGRAPGTVVREWTFAFALLPLEPVVDGHTLIIPKMHVRDFSTNPNVSGATMIAAAEFAADFRDDVNIITSRGYAATQSVFHLHLHVVPRHIGDGLALPWYSGKTTTPQEGAPCPQKASQPGEPGRS